ncbi:MAG: hypothetical protein MJ244_03515 [Clostridia bacterium]|nr:hypothetical protein [Clostridia bacterium]
MKKLFMLSLALMMGLSFVACTKEEVKEDVYAEEEVVEEEVAEEEVAEEEAVEEVAEEEVAK